MSSAILSPVGTVPAGEEAQEKKATDRVFGEIQRELLNTVLAELDLKTDREGNRWTAYSLRLMEGADIY